MRIVVNTPSGNIGRPVVDQLLDARHEVVIISRHPDKVAAATAKGAKLVCGSIDDSSTLDRALKVAPSHGSELQELHGPEDLDQPTAARTLTEVVGRPVEYVEVSAEQWRQGASGAGMPSFFIERMLDMYGELQADRMERVLPRSATTTNRTTFQEFARAVLKPAIEAEAARVASVGATASA